MFTLISLFQYDNANRMLLNKSKVLSCWFHQNLLTFWTVCPLISLHFTAHHVPSFLLLFLHHMATWRSTPVRVIFHGLILVIFLSQSSTSLCWWKCRMQLRGWQSSFSWGCLLREISVHFLHTLLGENVPVSQGCLSWLERIGKSVFHWMFYAWIYSALWCGAINKLWAAKSWIHNQFVLLCFFTLDCMY